MVNKNAELKEKVISFWYKKYGLIIPSVIVLVLMILNVSQIFKIVLICQNPLFSDMLTALITCMSIIISIFGFLIPSLISAKNDKMVKYFIENADMNVFVNKIRSLILSGLTGILLSVLLYLNASFNNFFLLLVLFLWIGVVLNFACNAYRFISIIIALLLTEKRDLGEKKCANEISKEKEEELNTKIQSLD